MVKDALRIAELEKLLAERTFRHENGPPESINIGES